MRRLDLSPWIAFSIALGACRTGLPLDSDEGALEASPPPNACGGTEVLASSPDSTCGACGTYSCNGKESVKCDDSGANACGACGPLPAEECNGRDDNCNGMIDEGCPFRVEVTNDTDEIYPRVRGDRVVFDMSATETAPYQFGMVTLPSEMVSVVTSAFSGRPLFDGKLLVWLDTSGGGRLSAFDVDAQTLLPPPAGTSGFYASGAAVFQGRIAFTSKTGVNIWDTAGASVMLVTDGQGDVALAAARVAFLRASASGTDVWTHDFASGTETNLSGDLGDTNDSPASDGSIVVWHRRSADTPPADEIYAYDFTTQTRKRLTAGPAIEPRISGSIACYAAPASDPRWGNGVTAHDIPSGRDLFLGTGGHCDIDGRRVVWSNARYTFDIFGQDLLVDQP